MKFFDRSNMFRLLTRKSYVKSLLKTRGEDFLVVEDQINRVLRSERWKRRFRQYFPRLSLNVFVTKIVKPDSKPSDTVEKFAKESLEATLPKNDRT